MAADGVEVTEGSDAHGGISLCKVGENGLGEVLGATVRAGKTLGAVDAKAFLAHLVDVCLVEVDEVVLTKRLALVGLGSVDSGR